MQESKLQNLDYGDRDSQGLFQQRTSVGWGTIAEITDPTKSSQVRCSLGVRTMSELNHNLWQNCFSLVVPVHVAGVSQRLTVSVRQAVC